MANPRTFHYLNQTGCYEVANVDDAREYLETRNAMDIVGISNEEQVRYTYTICTKEIGKMKTETYHEILYCHFCRMQYFAL